MSIILEIGGRRGDLYGELLAVWEDSVCATHTFLTDGDIERLKPDVRRALEMVPRLFAVEERGEIVGLMGVDGESLEMLFLRSGMRGKGLGKLLLRHAVDELGARVIEVHEQNPAALAFYRHCGFAVYDRSDFDGQGRPFPILRLTRKILETERLLLREMTAGDFDAVASMLRNAKVMHAWEKTFSDDEIRGWIERNRERYRRYGYGYWLAVDKSSGEVVGQIGLLPETVNGKEHLGIGWILAGAHWKKGYAAEGAQGCLDYAFRRLGAGRVIADIRPENTASLRLAERLGMIFCGEYDKMVDGKIMPHRLGYFRTPLIEVDDYDPVWGENFRKLESLLEPLRRKFGGVLEHVGSTAVPGLAAKPVIDADYILADPGLWAEVKRELESLGFFHRGDGGLPGREMFSESLALDFRHNFYVCRADSPHLDNHLKLRDYLRSRPDQARRYGELKKEMARRFPDDVDGYCAGKSDLLSEFLAAAGFDDGTVRKINAINKSFGNLDIE